MPDLGIGETLAGIGTFLGTTAPAAIAGVAGDIGIGSATSAAIGSGVTDAAIGAGLGAAEAGITGGDAGLGALTGGVTGGAIGGFGGLAGDALGIGATAGDALAGAAGGALGAGITGGNPLTGTIGGAASGLTTGLLSGTTPGGASAGGTTAPGASAPALAAPSGTPLTDLTAGLDPGSVTAGTANIGSASASPGGISNITGTGAGTDIGAGSLGAGGALPGTPAGTNLITGQAGTPAAGGSGGPSTISTAIDNPTSGNILKALGANAGPLVAGAGLVANLAGNQTLPGQNEIGELAGGLQTQGAQLESYIKNGTLPPGAQQGIDQATKAAQAAVRSKYAANGMSGSSAETQDLNNVTEQAQAQQFQEASALLNEGINATSISGELYAEMMNFDQKQSAATGAAIASLAGALAGGGTTIKLA